MSEIKNDKNSLPDEFLNRMKQMLGSDYDAFLKSYDHEKYQALRINNKKARMDFKDSCGYNLSPVSWAENGYYFSQDDKPGKSSYHEAGLYYIQEPSAMSVAGLLGIDRDNPEHILDLCAAPGGKSTQIAALMNEKSILVCNEISPARAKILSLNVERMGIKNAMVTNESPEKLSSLFEAYFDRILVDAPCSGEGMFRKNNDASMEWSTSNVEMCAKRQDEILNHASTMLAPGGTLVYSTCTFAPLEDEGSVCRFLSSHPDFELKEISKKEGMDNGRADFIDNPCDHIDYTLRIWPHKAKGEGHFAAVLVRKGDKVNAGSYCPNGIQKGIKEKTLKSWTEFRDENINKQMEGTFCMFGEQLYLVPSDMPSSDRLKVLRFGLHLGTIKKDRFEPSHSLALFLKKSDVIRSVEIGNEDLMARQYLNGQALHVPTNKGWNLVTYDGYSIGWGKSDGRILKNHYPKGLRLPNI